MRRFVTLATLACMLSESVASARESRPWPAEVTPAEAAQHGYFPPGTPSAFLTRAEGAPGEKQP